jgi:membrane fusion protein, multidrug efflux system
MVNERMNRFVAAGFAGCLAVVIGGCAPATPASAHDAVSSPATERAVDPKTPAPGAAAPGSAVTGPHELVVTGPVTMEQQLDVVALRPGVIAALNSDVDAQVSAGQALAQIDDRQLLSDKNAAESKLHSAQADLKNREAEVQVRTADLNRAKKMRDEGINTVEDLEHAKFALEAIQFEAERQTAEVESQQATLASLDLEIEKTRIAAPFAGVVSQRYVRMGEYVHTGDRLFQITGNSPLEVRFTLPAREGARIRRGDQVTVSPLPDFSATAPAAVTHISPVVDPGSGTIEVRAVLSRSIPGLLPGMVASVRVDEPR